MKKYIRNCKKVCLAIGLLLASVYCLADDYIGLRPVLGATLPTFALANETVDACYMIYSEKYSADVDNLTIQYLGNDPNATELKQGGYACRNQGLEPLCLQEDGTYDLLKTHNYCYMPVTLYFRARSNSRLFTITNTFNIRGSVNGKLVYTNQKTTRVSCKANGDLPTCPALR